MDEQYILDLFNQLGGESKFGKFNDFKQLITTDQSYQKDFYNSFGSNTLGNFNDFKSLVSATAQQPVQQQPVQQPPVKKKEPMASSSEDGSLDWFKPKKPEYKPTTAIPGTDYTVPEKGPIQADVESEEAWKKKVKREPEKAALPATDYMQGYLKEEGKGVPFKEEKEYPLSFLGRRSQAQIEEETPEFIKPIIDNIDNKLLRQGKDIAKKELDYYLEDAGFEVSYEQNNLSDVLFGVSPDSSKNTITITAPDGESRTFKVYSDTEDEANRIKQFVKEKSNLISEKDYLYKNENRKFRSKEEINNEVKSISNQEKVFNDEYKQYLNMEKDIKDISADLKRWEDFGEQNTPKYIQTKAYLEERKKEFDDYAKKLQGKASVLQDQQKNLEKAAGKYLELQSEKGTFGGTLYRSFANSAANIYSQYLRMTYSGMIEILPSSAIYSQEEFDDAYRKRVFDEGFIKTMDEPLLGKVPYKNQVEIVKQVDAALRDRFKKAGITGYLDGEKLEGVTTVESIRTGLSEFLNQPTSTTQEYLEKRQKEGGFVERGMIGLAGSLPAMVGGPIVRVANMFTMTTDAAMREMDNDPSFAGISENEKALVALPIGVVGAALEEIGLRNLVKGSSVTTSIIKTVLGRVPTNASASLLRKTTFDVVAEMGLRGTLALTGATLAEAETGAAQQISEYAIKDTYNWMKGQKMFDNPEMSYRLDSQYIKDIADAAVTEAVGGFVMGVPYSIGKAFEKDGFRGLDDDTFKIFEELSKDNDSKKFFVTSLKNKINQGEITAKQGNKILDAYNQSSGMIAQVPDEITDTESRKIAMDLMTERKRLEAKKQGKDDALAKPIQDKINQINEQLTKLTEDAIQKQTAGEVSLQPETGAGQEVEVGGPEAKPKITPEESKRKEFKESIRTKAKEEISKILDDDNLTDQQKEEAVKNVVDAAKSQMQIDIENLPSISIGEIKEQEFVTPTGFKNELLNLGYTEADISNMTFEQQQDIVLKQTQAPKIESTAKVDSVKENERQERIAQMQKELDEQAPVMEQGGMEQPVSEVIPTTEQPTTELTPETRTAEQEADLLEELISGKKKEPVVTETVVEEATPKEEVPAEQFTEQDKARKAELEEAMRKADKRRKNITVGETTMTKAEAKAELDALTQKEQAVPTEVAPTVTPTTEVAPTTETKPAENPALANVKATAKALKEKSNLLSSLRDLIANVDRNVVIINGEKYTKDEIKKIIYDKISDEIGYEIDEIDIVDIQITGSRIYGTSRKNSDLDIILEYKGDISEDSLFNIANENPIKIDGVKIDINPIKAEKSGTISEQAKKERRYFDEIADEKYISKAYHSTKADGSNPELVQAVEEALAPKPKETKGKNKILADAVRKNLKIKGPGGLQSNILGILPAIWNAGVETMATAIEAGVAVTEAVQKAIEYIREKHGKKFNEAAAEKKLLIGHYKGAIEIAREAKVTNEGLKTYFKRQGLTDAQIEALLKVKEKAEKKPISKEKIIGKPKPKMVTITVNDMTELKKRIKIEAKASKEGKKQVKDAVKEIVRLFNQSKVITALTRADLKKIINLMDKVYDDVSLQKAVGEMFDIILKSNPDLIEVSKTKLNEEFNRKVKAGIREGKKDLNAKRKMLTAAIRDMEKKGSITVRQATALINKVNAVNLDNPVMVERLLDYAEKVFNDADYADKLSQAKKLQSTAKKLSKNSEKNAEVRELAKKFAEIDPAMVENIDEYIEYASQVVEGLKGSKLTAKGVSLADAVDIDKTSKYIDKALEYQAEKQKQMMADKMQSLMGVDVSDLTYEQLLELLDDSSKPIDKYKETIIRDIINKVFNTYSSIIEKMFETGKNPFDISEDAETIEFKDSTKELVKNFMSMDLNSLSPREALMAVDALNNFIVNGSTAGMQTVYNNYIANKNAKTVKEKGIKGKSFKFLFIPKLGRMLIDEFASLPLLLESAFKSSKVALYFSKMSGILDLVNGAARATTITQKTIARYLQEFSKLKPNDKAFNDAYNATERGMIAFMSRNIIGSKAAMQKEFNDRKSLIEKSIDELSKGSEKERQKAKLYQEAYDKILKDSKNAQEVKEKSAKENVNAVDWWTNEWSKHFDELSDVSLNVYNKVLDRDLNYTTDRYSKLDLAPDDKKALEENNSAYAFNNGTMYKKEAGALKETTDKTGNLPKNKDGETTRYVDLSFDSVQASSLYDAMADIKTAGAIRQVETFFKSEDTKSLFSAEDFKLIRDRVKLAIRNIRNQQAYSSSELESLVKALDKFSKFSATLALAGVTQPFKQTIPLMFNTLINAGQFDPFGVTLNKSIREFIDNSGRAIANRGVESQVYIESINRLIDEAARSKPEQALKFIEQANDLWMKVFLANPDKYVARASWMAYYEQSLKKQGLYNTTKKVTLPSGDTAEILTKGIDYATHEINEDAADYAQMMVDRQQNITDTKLAGRMYSDTEGGWGKKVLTRMLLPLASFRLNQYLRTKADVSTLLSKSNTVQDKARAARSLAGLAAEMLVFKSMVIGFGLTWHYISDAILAAITGDEDDEEEKQKNWNIRLNNLIRGQATSAVTDLFSPVPIFDPFVKYGANTALDITQDFLNVADENKFELFVDDPKKVKTYADALGMYGIGIDKINEIIKTSNLAITGKFKDDYGNERTITDEQRELLSWSLIPSIILNTGVLPGAPEFNNVMGKITKDVKNSGMTEKQLEVYKETGKTKEEVKADKEEWKEYKEEALNGFKSEKQFKERDHEGYLKAIKDGSIYEYKKREREREEEKHKDEPFRGLSEEKFKKLYPTEWKKFYGPGTAYYESQRTPEALERKREEARREAEFEREEKKAEAERLREAAQKRSGY